MYLIGLTGGIASGKSVVAVRLAEHGAMRIDADALAREVVEPGEPALARIEEEFGAELIGPDGHLDRAALASVIFADPERRAALNAITHPAVKDRARTLMNAAVAADPHAVIVYDVPLLIEARVDAEHEFDLIVVVNASSQVRLSRLMELRGLSRAEATHRLNSQVSDTQRLAIADVIIDSNGTLEDTLRQADALWESISHSA